MSQKLMCLLMPMAFALGGCRAMPQSTANTSPSAGALAGSSRTARLKLPIESAAFWGSTHAWIVTGDGDLLHTQTEGATWTEISGESVGGFERISFVDREKGWATNSQGQVWATQDGGLLWTPRASVTGSKAFAKDQINS